MKKTLIIQAPAKINICLWVKEKRPDNYHEIASLMQTVTLSDTITLQEVKDEGIFIECNHPGVPNGPDNLAYKAAMLIMEHCQIPPRILIRIEKRIPVAAGLAGGSSDAAAVMIGLVRMYDKSLLAPDLMNLAKLIGSDVPFMIRGGLAMASGRGEILSFYESPRPPLAALIAVPKNIEVSTRWAYENYHPGENAHKSEVFPEILPFFKRRDLTSLREKSWNDLESVTFQRHPEVAAIKEKLLSFGKGLVMMSGSGPSVFGLFEDRKVAAHAASVFDPNKVDLYLENTSRNAGR